MHIQTVAVKVSSKSKCIPQMIITINNDSDEEYQNMAKKKNVSCIRQRRKRRRRRNVNAEIKLGKLKLYILNLGI